MRQIDKQADRGLDRFAILEAGEIPSLVEQHSRVISTHAGSWAGGTMDQLRVKCRVGDEALVAESEKFLASIENQIPVSQGWRNVDDVVGAVPNVPAFLAGHPQHMRRRQRAAKETAPLAIYMDLTSSGMISAAQVQRRGLVLMALTRMLVEHRPVALYVGVSIGDAMRRSNSYTVAWRIDTTPLDLARAAYHVGSTTMSRAFGYGVAQSLLGSGANNNIPWPFSNHGHHCHTAEARLRTVLDWNEVMYVPPIYGTDPLTADPVGWLKREMQKYVPSENNGDE